MVATDKRGQSVWSCSWLHNYRYIKSGSQVKRKKNSKTTPSFQFLSPIQIIPSIHRMRDMVLPGEVAMLLQALHTETDNHSRPTCICIFLLWRKAGVSSENPHRRKENMQTPQREAPRWPPGGQWFEYRTFFLWDNSEIYHHADSSFQFCIEQMSVQISF